MLDDAAVGVDEVERHPAELGTLTTICRAVETVLRRIALTAIADTQRPVDEDLQFDVGHSLVNSPYLVDGEFARQDDA